MKRLTKNRSYAGFTLIELLMSITIMGTMLGLALIVIIGSLRFFVFSNNLRQNQENGRNIIDTMTREIRFGKLILPTVDNANGSVVCVADETNRQLIIYSQDGFLIRRKTLSYVGTEPPVDNCEPINGITQTSDVVVSLPKMAISNFNIQRTAGAPQTINPLDNGVDPKVVGVVINVSFLTGVADPEDPTKCKVGDIYCSQLQLVTAINNRGKSQ